MATSSTANSDRARVSGVNEVRCGCRRCWICDVRGMLKHRKRVSSDSGLFATSDMIAALAARLIHAVHNMRAG